MEVDHLVAPAVSLPRCPTVWVVRTKDEEMMGSSLFSPWGVISLGERVGITVLVAWWIGYTEAEPCKKQVPSSLSGIQMLGSLDILKVSVVSDDVE